MDIIISAIPGIAWALTLVGAFGILHLLGVIHPLRPVPGRMTVQIVTRRTAHGRAAFLAVEWRSIEQRPSLMVA